MDEEWSPVWRATQGSEAPQPLHPLPLGRWHPGLDQESTDYQSSPVDPQRTHRWVSGRRQRRFSRVPWGSRPGWGGWVAGAPPSSDPGFSAFNPRGRAQRSLGSAERASGQCGAGGERVQSQGQRQLAGMAPAAASGGSTLPSGFSVFVTFPDLLFILEFVSDSAPCSGEGMGWVVLLGSCAPLFPVTPAAWRVPKSGKFSPSLGGLFLSKLADRFPRQVQENLFLELCSFPRQLLYKVPCLSHRESFRVNKPS